MVRTHVVGGFSIIRFFSLQSLLQLKISPGFESEYLILF